MRILSLTHGGMHAHRGSDAASKRIFYMYACTPPGMQTTMLDLVPMNGPSGPLQAAERFVIHRRKAVLPSICHHSGRLGLLPEHATWWSLRATAPLIMAGLAKGVDVAVVERIVAAGLLSALPASVPVVYASHNVEADWYAPVVAKTRFPSFYQKFVEDMEGRLVRRAALVIALTHGEKQRFVERYGIAPEKVEVVPMGFVETPRASAQEAQRALANHGLAATDKLALFCGANFHTNQEAVDILVRQVAPALDPGVRLVIVGSVCNHLRQHYGAALPPNIMPLGFVEDLAGLYAAIPLAINAVVSGAGANVKTIEYLGAGMDLVSTPHGMRGYEGLRDNVLSCPPESMAATINGYFAGQRPQPNVNAVAQYGHTALAKRYFQALQKHLGPQRDAAA